MQQVDDPPSLAVGTEVSAKYKGAFCEAKVSKVVRNIKVKVAYKHGLGSGIVSDDAIKSGLLRVGSIVEVKHPDRKDSVEATVTKIQDCSQYTVVFDDGDITTLRRTALCLKSGRHFNESETLDQLPLTHPEHFGNPVVGGRRGRRRPFNGDSSDDEDESDTKEVVNEKEEHIGKVVCVETESKKKDKEKWFPGLVVSPNAQATVRIRVKDEYLVRSFKDGRYYTVPKKEATEFTREAAAKQDGPAVQAALEYLDSDVLPPHWDRDALFGLSNSSSDEDGEMDSDSSDDEPREEKDRFVAQLYKYMDDRGTPLNKVPSIQSRDVDLYRLFRAVQKRGGYNRVTAQNQWKSIAIRLGFSLVTVSITNLVKQAYKKFLQPYGEFHRKLGCSMLMTPRNSNRSKGRSLVRANSVASPKPAETLHKESSLAATTTTTSGGSNILSNKSMLSSSIAQASTSAAAVAAAAYASERTAAAAVAASTAAALAAQSASEESENTSESSIEVAVPTLPPVKVINKRKISVGGGGGAAGGSANVVGKVKGLVEKYEEKSVATAALKDDGDVPLSKIKAAAAATAARAEEKEAASAAAAVATTNTTTTAVTPAATATVIVKDNTSATVAAAVAAATSTTSHGPPMRDGSPTGPPGSSKKELKFPKKQTPQSDEKRSGKRKKDDVSVEMVDAGDFIVEIGDKLKVYYHEKKVTYEAKVIEISLTRGTQMYLVHYTGWNNRYDEWVPRERIAENLTKGSKQKGRSASTGNLHHSEKSKENPPKPPTAAQLLTPTGLQMGGASGSSVKTPTTTSTARRGRGRSDSLPPRSTTPSSVASNSSRTKSPATSSAAAKRRPTRTLPSNTRRTSTNVSDVSMPTESDTDSDEPVRRPTRGGISVKDCNYKAPPRAYKAPLKHKSRHNSDDDDDSDEDDNDRDADEEEDDDVADVDEDGDDVEEEETLNKRRASTKGRDYDLNQIRSELKGFQEIKSPSPADNEELMPVDVGKKKISEMTASTTIIKTEPADAKASSKAAPPTTTTASDASSESDSFADDDSQSSDKTTTLENMTKKFQQKINADKQRQQQQQLPGKAQNAEKTAPSKTHIVEKIIKESQAEKRKESLKIKPSAFIKEESAKLIKIERDISQVKVVAALTPSVATTSTTLQIKQEPDKTLASPNEIKSSILAPARFGSSTLGKYASVIVEKPLKKSVESSLSNLTPVKKFETPKKHSGGVVLVERSLSPKKHNEASLLSQSTHVLPLHKEIIKIEPPAACSPTSSTSSTSSSTSSSASSSSSSTSSSASSSSASTRSLPDMSKLDISGSSTPSSIISASSVANIDAPSAPPKDIKLQPPAKPISPDIYEFKDPEPFEYEVRAKSSGMCAMSSTLSAAAAASAAPQFEGKRKKLSATAQQLQTTNAIDSTNSALLGRKKRGSPLKDASAAAAVAEKQAKQLKLEEKMSAPTTTLVLEAKLRSNTPAKIGAASNKHALAPATLTPPAATVATAISTTSTAAATTVSITAAAISTSTPNKSMPPPPSATAGTLLTPQKNEYFDALRRSPSFNLNINALNEELAQTVQETTRALTDALQTPQTPTPPAQELTPSKMASKTSLPPLALPAATTTATIAAVTTSLITPVTTTPPATKRSAAYNTAASPNKLVAPAVTPPAAVVVSKPVIGSPFIETRKDLSNVFELSAADEGAGGSSSHKDNKFELENVKQLLSASAYDLAPAQRESKPTSIADKVLKAISQKKEEEESKNKEQEKAKEAAMNTKPAEALTSTDALKLTDNLGDKSEVEKSTTDVFSTLSGADILKTLPLAAPLQINTELPTSSVCAALKRDSPLHKIAAHTMRPLLGSPEPKLGLLESITVKNNDLSETIQKLECALQKKTPLPLASSSASTLAAVSPASSLAAVPAVARSSAPASNFSDNDNNDDDEDNHNIDDDDNDSMDSTDSERRLVIEDVEESAGISSSGDALKSPNLASPASVVSTMASPTVVSAPMLISPQTLPATVVTAASSAGAAASIAIVPAASLPLKLLTPVKAAPTAIIAGGVNITANVLAKLPGNATLLLSTKPATTLTASVGLLAAAKPLTQPLNAATSVAKTPDAVIIAVNRESNKLFTPSKATLAQPTTRITSAGAASTATVVPIDLPDIPVSVVVASSAVPSVVAAAQAAAAAAQQTANAPALQLGVKQSSAGGSTTGTGAASTLLHVATATTSSFSANSASLKTFENAAAIRSNMPPASNVTAANATLHNIATSVLTLSSTSTTAASSTSSTVTAIGASSSGAFFSAAGRTELRPDDGVKPIVELPTGNNDDDDAYQDLQILSGLQQTSVESLVGAAAITATNAAAAISSSSCIVDAHNDSINLLLCEETIPGSPAPAFGKEEPLASLQLPAAVADLKVGDYDEQLPSKLLPSTSTGAVPPTPNSSPNDSASQDESSEDLKKHVDIENEVSPRKRRRTRKQSEMLALMSEQQTKRRRQQVCSKKNTAGSDSDDNSDTISQRSTTSARQPPPQTQLLLPQPQLQPLTTGGRPCPYNFLVQLDASMNPDQRIAVVLKQIQDLRKTYNMIKGDLASIDRRRKKLRRREREKKQQLQQQQQVKITT